MAQAVRLASESATLLTFWCHLRVQPNGRRSRAESQNDPGAFAADRCAPLSGTEVRTGSTSVLLFLANGDGTFQAARRFGGGSSVFAAVADFDGDRALDLVEANYASNTVS